MMTVEGVGGPAVNSETAEAISYGRLLRENKKPDKSLFENFRTPRLTAHTPQPPAASASLHAGRP